MINYLIFRLEKLFLETNLIKKGSFLWARKRKGIVTRAMGSLIHPKIWRFLRLRI